MAPRSRTCVPSHTRWLDILVSSASMTRRYRALAGTLMEASFSTADLTFGNHTITFSVKDNDGVWSDEAASKDIKNELIEKLDFIAADQPANFVYFLTLYNIFKDFLEDIDEENIIKSKTGFKDTLVWDKLYKFQKDGVLGAIDKLEKYNGCIIADSVGLGKTFEALAVIKYFELLNFSGSMFLFEDLLNPLNNFRVLG